MLKSLNKLIKITIAPICHKTVLVCILTNKETPIRNNIRMGV